MSDDFKVSDSDEASISVVYDFFNKGSDIKSVADILCDRGIELKDILYSKEISDFQRVELIKALEYDKRVIK